MRTDDRMTTTPRLAGRWGALRALADRSGVALDLDGRAVTDGDRGLVALVTEPVDARQACRLARRLADEAAHGRRAVLAATVAAAPSLGPALPPGLRFDDVPVWRPLEANPIVADRGVVGTGVAGPLDGCRIVARDALGIRGEARVIMVSDDRPLVVEADGMLVFGAAEALSDEWIAAGENAVLARWALTGELDRRDADAIRAHVPSPVVDMALPTALCADPADFDLSLLPDDEPGSARFVRAAAHAARHLPAVVHDALVDFADEGHPSGALVVRRLPVGDVPPTPDDPTASAGKDHVSEFVLLTAARRLGQPVGYRPEHGGDIVQNLLPTRAAAARQTSTSSAVELMFHTEAAFHPYRPRFLLLLCLRGDPEARTTLSSITGVVGALPLWARRALSETRYRLAVDESYLGHRPTAYGAPLAVLSGSWDQPQLVFDADLMVGTDDEAQRALELLAEIIAEHQVSVVLEAGDLLVVDNTVAVHGRSPFPARFDGTDRWIQRSFAVADLAPSAADRIGRVVATEFAG